MGFDGSGAGSLEFKVIWLREVVRLKGKKFNKEEGEGVELGIVIFGVLKLGV